jgi:hypothetical protein
MKSVIQRVYFNISNINNPSTLDTYFDAGVFAMKCFSPYKEIEPWAYLN